MKIGILGTGDVGRALCNAFIATGHEVKMGSREAANEKAAAWVKQAGPRASAGTFSDAVKFADVAVVATAWSGTESALRMAGLENFVGKVVVDATNPLKFTPGRPPELALGHTDSGGEQVQRWVPDAHVVKAFNIVGNAHFFQPLFPGGPPDMFIAGNQDAAKRAVGGILKDFGWGVVDLGGIESSRYLEAMCMTWVVYGVVSGGWNHAFRMLHK
jgi:8-hydroxy-5-deazaflavin:NADPH oxidoreductase